MELAFESFLFFSHACTNKPEYQKAQTANTAAQLIKRESTRQKLPYHVDLATCRWPGLWDPPTQLRAELSAEPRGAAAEDLATCRA
ncbi:hypothetical protein V6N11_003319 [Hibiscus sabdariffa]|uniref:Uncharacterized protein n=1 Tax=Hibiscus sabdariffa TaxID=183260 RepID=A0ABR2SCV8_9ROSI